MSVESIPSGTKVLVTGATGFTGSVLVRKLVNAGLHVTAIARPSSNIEPLRDLDIQWIRGDVFDEETINKAVTDVSYIFHVAAAYREAKISDETYYNVHVKSTQLIAKKALELPNFKRFVHVSTVGVHSHIDDPPADEEYRFNPDDVYQKTKAEAELWIRKFSQEKGLPLAVIRPAAIFGPGDRRLLKVFKMSTKKWFPILGYGKCYYHLIHVDDLTDCIILAATEPNALGEVFICGNTEPTTLKEMALTISQVYNKQICFIRIPAWPFFILGALCELAFRPFGLEPPIYRRRVAFYTKDRAFNTQKMQSTLGFTPKFDNHKGLQITAEWYLEQGWLHGG